MVRYARCNNFMSLALNNQGEGCRYMSMAEKDQDVVDDLVRHLKEAHNVDGKQLIANIKACIYTTRRKTFGTRPPGEEEHWQGHPV